MAAVVGAESGVAAPPQATAIIAIKEITSHRCLLKKSCVKSLPPVSIRNMVWGDGTNWPVKLSRYEYVQLSYRRCHGTTKQKRSGENIAKAAPSWSPKIGVIWNAVVEFESLRTLNETERGHILLLPLLEKAMIDAL